MSYLRVVVCHGVCRNSNELSKMALINVLAFVVLKILLNLVFVLTPLLVTADVSKFSKSVRSNIAFILNILSETVNVFAKICLVLKIKIVSFIKTRFY